MAALKDGILECNSIPPKIRTVSIFAAICVVWLYWIPGLVAYAGDVWDDEGVAERLPLELRQLRISDTARVQAVGYTGDRTTHLFYVSYLSLFTIIVSYWQSNTMLNWRKTACAGLALYAFWNWPLWVRNILANSDARRIYSCFNADIHFPSFVLQELRVLGFAILAAVLIGAALNCCHRRAYSDVSMLAHIRAKISTASALSWWQVRSTVLALAFVPLSYFYWRNIIVRGDSRYLASAMMLHTIWLFLWIIITVPLLQVWNEWFRYRENVLNRLASMPPDAQREATLFLEQSCSVSTVHAIASSVVAVFSFFSPLVAVAFQ